MLKRPNVQFFEYRDLVLDNNLVNVDLATEVYTSHKEYEFEGKVQCLYTIIFLMVNREEVIWSFNDKEARDLQYHSL